MAIRGRWAALAVVLTLVASSSMLSTVARAAEPARNVALAANGATAAASGQEVPGQWGPDKLIDGLVNPGAAKADQSRWSSRPLDDEHATITFAKPQRLHHINIVWEYACAPVFSILGSTDGTTFDRPIISRGKNDCTNDAGQGDPKTYPIPAALSEVELKAIRVIGHERRSIDGTKYGFSMWEIEAWTGKEPPPPPPPAHPVKLVPQPADLKVTANAEPFRLKPATKIVAPGEAKSSGEFLATILRASTGYQLPVVDSAGGQGNIALTVTPQASAPEGYQLTVTENGITARGNSSRGAFNSVQTIRQLFPAFIESKHRVRADWAAPAVVINDAPRFAYRSVQLDPARSFVTVPEVKKVLDTMAAYKMSFLHMHLADDQGWRIEITNKGRVPGDDIDYTRLTSISGLTAMNSHDRQIGHSELGRTGYYTQADYQEIVRYAADRHITVVPEIDVPGHTNAALHAIGQLNTPGSSHPATKEEPLAPANGTGNVGYSYLDPKSEASYRFVTHVFKQLAEMTPGQFLHLGGDESHAMAKRYGHDGYFEMVKKIVTIIQGLGKTPIGWNEVAGAGLRPGDTIQYWYGSPAEAQAAVAKNGAKLVVSQSDRGAYLDQKYNAKTPMGLTWAKTGDFDVFYSWDPKATSGVADEHIRGVEGVMWSEAIRGGDQVEFMAFMRSLAIAEMGWTPQDLRKPADFKDRVAYQGARLAVRDVQFFDGATTTWQAALAGTNSTAKPGRTATFNVGLLAAPGTLSDGKIISPDLRNDPVNTPSASKVPPGSAVSIDWGDATPATTAAVETNLPRSAFNSSGQYYLTGKHSYAHAGTYNGSLTFAGKQVPFTVVVGEDQPGPVLLRPVWDGSVKPTVAVERPVVRAGERNPLIVTGFQPNVFADLMLGDTKLGQLRPGPDGNRSFAFLVPADTPAGVYQVRVVQGARVGETQLTVYSDAPSLSHPIPHDKLAIAGFSSQATNEEAPNGLATAAIDGAAKTFWHSQWANPAAKPPHWLAIKLPGTCQVTGLEYTPRQDNENGRAKGYQVFTSMDGATWGAPVATGEFSNTETPKLVAFKATPGKFVKFQITSNQAGTAFASAGEVRIGGLCDGQQAASVTAKGASGSITSTELAASTSALTVRAGEKVTLTGSHIPGDGQVTVWQVADQPKLVAAAKSAGGTFTATVTVPADAKPGDLRWRVTKPGMGEVQIPLTVKVGTEPTPDSPALSVSKQLLRVGERFVVTGKGFVPGQVVRIELHSKPVTLAPATVDRNGTFSVTVAVPAVRLGAHQVVAVSPTGKQLASTPITVVKAPTGLPDTGALGG